jgi:uncharacterized protein (TIGR03435 family)
MRRDVNSHPVLALVAAKGGAMLKESAAGGAAAWPRSAGPEGSMHMEARNMTMPALADLPGAFLNRTLADQTGIRGTYHLPLGSSVEDPRSGSRASGVIATDSAGGEEGPSSIAASLQLVGSSWRRAGCPWIRSW